jgi:hypothetical protein
MSLEARLGPQDQLLNVRRIVRLAMTITGALSRAIITYAGTNTIV